MKLKVSPPTIDAENPFRYDDLKRAPLASNLTELVKAAPPPLVLAVDSPWGTGKTTFVKMWQALLKKENIHSIYFNAWETDFSDDPLTAFVGEITEYIKNEHQTVKRKTIADVRRLTTYLARRSLPLAVKAATAGIVDLDEVEKEVLGDIGKSLAEDAVKKYTEKKAKLEEFRVAIGEVIKEITKTTSNSRFIIFVDELDRCKPTYCVELLERIKHLFNTENLIFVLSIDGEQIEASVRALYGEGINAKEYLRKFFDLNLKLPEPDSKSFTQGLYDRFELDNYFNNRTADVLKFEKNHLVDFFAELSNIFKLSLRTREQLFTAIRVAMFMTPPNYHLFPILLMTLIILKSENPLLYEKYFSKDGSATEIMAYIAKKPEGKLFVDSKTGAAIEAYLLSARDEDNSEARFYYEALEDGSGASQEIKMRAQHITSILNSFRMNSPSLSFIKNKIELANLIKS